MKHLNIDIETFSSVDIKSSGLYKYVQSADFKVILLAYSIDFAPAVIVDIANGGVIPPSIIIALFDNTVRKHAYNAAFEWYCLSKHFKYPKYIDWIAQWDCTMFHGMYCGYPAGLANLGIAMKLPASNLKMSEGNALIRYFCIPCSPTKTNGERTRNLPHHDTAKWDRFKAYCTRDVDSEVAIYKRLESIRIPEDEKQLWRLDVLINHRGILIDHKFVENAIGIYEKVKDELMREASEISGLDNPNSQKQLLEWVQSNIGGDEEIPDLKKKTVDSILSGDINDPDVKRILEIRRESAKTSIKKYHTMKAVMCADGRARGTLMHYGAQRTGRWAGRLIQLQNLPRNYIEPLDLARELVLKDQSENIKLVYGSVTDTLSQLIRTSFIAPEGKILAVADFNSIEARITAWLANEQWAMNVFATHGKIYEATAAQMFNVPLEKIKKGNPEYELRSKGKVATLALGYGGGVSALVAMGALTQGLTEEELPEIVAKWRAANKNICGLWYKVQNAILDTVRNCKTNDINGLVTTSMVADFTYGYKYLEVRLPSGRCLYYSEPVIEKGNFDRDSLFYYGTDQKTRKWGKLSAWGGKLVENIVQAIARDCLAVALIRLENAGHKTIMHVHDEVILDAERDIDADGICELISQPISWAPGLILKAAGFKNDYYMKD